MNEHEAGLLADDLDEEMYFQVQCCGLDWLCLEIQTFASCIVNMLCAMRRALCHS
jgi:hypothetical protein